jgi:hypothetical protein
MNPTRKRTGLLMLVFALTGCASIGPRGLAGDLKDKILVPIVKPILGFTERDAQATLRWVEKKVKAGRLSSADATLARRCPDAVLEITEMGKLLDAPPDIEEGGGLILFGTKSKAGGQTMELEVRAMLIAVISTCGELVPVNRLLPYFR